MNAEYPYTTNVDIKYDHLQVVDIPAIVEDCSDQWFNQSLTLVNDSVILLGIIQGEYHWHKHDTEDEFFFVIEGELCIDFQDREVVLQPKQGMTVTKGILHRTRAVKKTIILMVETKSIAPTGD